MILLSIDPGDTHCGLAQFSAPGQIEHVEQIDVNVWEVGPEEAADYVARNLINRTLDVLVVERFRLYGDKAQQQVGSEMLTSELIGVLKYLVRSANELYEAKGDRIPVELALQGADIQNPMRKQLRARGIKSQAKGKPHGQSAELHGYFYLFRMLESRGATLPRRGV